MRFLLPLALLPAFAPAQLPQWTELRNWPSIPAGGASYDAARERVVWVGNSSGASVPLQTWEWDGAAWQVKAHHARITGDHRAQAYDRARRRTVMFGSTLPGGPNFVHEWDGSQWTSLPSNGPPARLDHVMAYDLVRQRVVLFGGRDASTSFNDTWLWDGNAWTQHTGVVRPAARTGACMAFDETNVVTVMFGGGSGSVTNDTWLFDGLAWQLAPPQGPQPSPRAGAGIAWHRGLGRIVIAGGVTANVRLADMWLWDGQTWSSSLAPLPEPRSVPVLVYEDRANRLLLLGGVNAQFGWRSDVWAYSATGWQQLLPSRTIEVTSDKLTLAMDPVSNRPLCLGSPSPGAFATYEHDGERFTRRQTATVPISNGALRAAVDVPRSRLVAVGDAGFGGNTTHEWDGLAWTRGPDFVPATFGFALGADPLTGRVLLFGGLEGITLRDWLWEWNGAAWSQRTTTLLPPVRYGAAMATDPVNARLVMFGGADRLRFMNDTWLFDGAAWQQAQPQASPPARWQHAMAFDGSRNLVMMLGGDANGAPLGGLWSWNGSNWAQVPLAQQIEPREPGLCYDPSARRLLMLVRLGYVVTQADGPHLLALASVPATVSAGGPGCGTPAPVLTGDLPYLGNGACQLELRAAPGTACLFAVADAAQTTPLGSGCSLHLAGTIALQFTVANHAGIARARLPVPFLAALRGVVLHGQAAALDPLGPLGGLALSNGLRLVAGD